MSTTNPTARQRFLLPIVAAFLGLAVGATAVVTTGDGGEAAATRPAPTAPTAQHSLDTDPEFSGTIEVSDEELALWKETISSPAERAEIVAHLRESFAGVAEFGDAGGAPPAEPGVAQPVLAYGVNGNHFWITASYADMARGAIWGAVRACSARAPGWLCNTVGNVLTSWARGWGSASNHGVWAAVYWAPPRYTGGRW